MPDLTLFSFENHALRISDQNGEPWFVLKDVMTAMGTKSTITQAIASIDQALGGGYVKSIPLATKGGMQPTTIAAEPAVTFLVSRGNTDDSRRLNRFIHVELLPSIRKTGGYSINPAPAPTPPAGRVIADGRYIELLEAENALLKQRQAPTAPIAVTTRKAARPVTDAERVEVLERYTAGESANAIGKAMGRSSSTVRNILRQANATDPQMALRLLDGGAS